jgi:glycosyltransferase involved in cell wall biosynthesis
VTREVAQRAWPNALRIRGPFRGPTGYDRHVRGFTRALHALGVAVQLHDEPRWGPVELPAELRDPWFETLHRPVGARTVVHFTMPPQVRATPGRIHVNYTMFEATPIPHSWAAVSGVPRRIVVPTASSAAMWLARGVAAERLAICPLGIDPDAYPPVTPGASPDLPADVIARQRRFLTVAEVSPRKNLPGLLRAWLRATRAADDAVLVLKPGYYAPGARARFATIVAEAEAATSVCIARAAPIHVVDRLLPDTEMPALFAAATHYISLSFGEGWDQPMVEAGAAGLRLIAPAHSAYLDYLDTTCATLLPSVATPAGATAGPALATLYAHATWWEPDEEAAVAAIRAAIDGQDAGLTSPRERILRDFTWERAAQHLLDVLAAAEAE